MIKINLLPHEIEKKALAKKKAFLIGIGIGFILFLFLGSYFFRIVKLTSINGRIKKVEKELKKLKPVVKRVNQIKNKKNALDKKVSVIKDLMKSRLVYPIFMEDFASILPSKVWVTNIKTSLEQGNVLNLSLGVMARDNYGVADFINALENSKKFSEIEFSGITTTGEGEDEARSFSISCKYSLSEKKDGS